MSGGGGSMQTRLAQGAARDAEAKWKQHQGACPACARAGRDRAGIPCSPGAGLRDEAARLRREALREARLDKAPNPAQEALF